MMEQILKFKDKFLEGVKGKFKSFIESTHLSLYSPSQNPSCHRFSS